MYVVANIPLVNPKVVNAKSLLTMNASSVQLDLEDGVAASSKNEARAMLVDAVLAYEEKFSHVTVRPNNDMAGFTADLDILVKAGLQDRVSITVPKMAMAEVPLRQMDIVFRDFKYTKGHSLLVETTNGLLNMNRIIERYPVFSIAHFGTEDLSFELGVLNTPNAMAHYASQFILGCKAYGIIACGLPGSFLQFKTKEEYYDRCKLAASMGFDGGMMVNPEAYDGIASAYQLTPSELSEYQHVISTAESSRTAMFTLNGKVYGPPEVAKLKNKIKRSTLEKL